MRLIPKPNPDEYPAYAKMYIDLLPDDGRLLEHLGAGLRATGELLRFLPEEQLLYRYDEGKWTIKEVLLHVIDDERIYAYRALRFARGDQTELPGFEQDDYVPLSGANGRSIDSLLCELEAVRDATLQLYGGLPEEALQRSGIANENRASVRALGYHIAGHELHHMRLVRERYLKVEG